MLRSCDVYSWSLKQRIASETGSFFERRSGRLAYQMISTAPPAISSSPICRSGPTNRTSHASPPNAALQNAPASFSHRNQDNAFRPQATDRMDQFLTKNTPFRACFRLRSSKSNGDGEIRQNLPFLRQQFLKFPMRSARTKIITPEFFKKFLFAVNNAGSPFHLRLGRKAPPPFAGPFKRNSIRCILIF